MYVFISTAQYCWAELYQIACTSLTMIENAPGPLVFCWDPLALPLLSWVSITVYIIIVKGGAIANPVYPCQYIWNAGGLLVRSWAPLGPTAALLVSFNV